MAKVKVKVLFQDKYDHVTRYQPGSEAEFSDEARVKDLVAKGWVEVIDEAPKHTLKETITAFGQEIERAVIADAMKSIGETVHHAAGIVKIEEKVAELSDEKKVALKSTLGIEDDPVSEVIELVGGKCIEIVSNADGSLAAYGEDNGETVHLAAGEYRSATHIYTVGDAGEVSVAEITDPKPEE